MRVLLNGREGELKLLRARDTLAEIIFQFNEIVVARMVPYFTAGTFTTMVSALYFRRTTDEQNRKKFDSIFMHIAADFLQQTPSIEFARILSALGVFKSVRNQVVHCFSCAYEEADNALKTILQQEPIVEKRSILTEAFTLVMEKICTSTDESNEMTFSEDFVMPRATTTATASTGGGVFVPGNTRRFSSK